MGLSQILLIVLSVIIVGISISVGIVLFQQQNVALHRQMMIVRINELVALGLAHYHTPASLGGGEGSFEGFAPAGWEESNQPSSNSGGVLLSENEANYFIEWYFNDRLKIIASSKIFGEGNYWKNSYNARVEAVFDNQGNVDAKGFVVSGDWKK